MFDGANLFGYCKNNPINLLDYTGSKAVCVELYLQALVVMRLCENNDTIRHDYSPILGLFHTPLERELTDSLANSDQFMGRVNEYIDQMEAESKTSFSKSEPIFFDFDLQYHTIQNNDLALGVGRVETLPITINKLGCIFGLNIYQVDYTIMDKFDFKDFSNENRNKFVIWLNQNLGYYPQESGLIEAYNWKCSGSFILIK